MICLCSGNDVGRVCLDPHTYIQFPRHSFDRIEAVRQREIRLGIVGWQGELTMKGMALLGVTDLQRYSLTNILKSKSSV